MKYDSQTAEFVAELNRIRLGISESRIRLYKQVDTIQDFYSNTEGRESEIFQQIQMLINMLEDFETEINGEWQC